MSGDEILKRLGPDMGCYSTKKKEEKIE